MGDWLRRFRKVCSVCAVAALLCVLFERSMELSLRLSPFLQKIAFQAAVALKGYICKSMIFMILDPFFGQKGHSRL